MRKNVINSYKDIITFIMENNLPLTVEDVVNSYGEYAKGFYCKKDIRFVISKNKSKVKVIAKHKGLM